MSDELGARERVVGALVGLAIGDALGLPVEFEPRKAREADPVSSLRGGGTWKLEPGSWSDDTALALCLAESIVLKGYDPDDFGQRSLDWLDKGYWSAWGQAIGVGGATHRALGRIRTGLPSVLAGGRGENDNGNGSLMRILPASIWLSALPEPARLRGIAAYSAVTHGHPRSILGCWLHCLVSAHLLRGEGPRDAYSRAMAEARGLLEGMPASLRSEAGAYARVLDGGLSALPASAIRASGYVVHCLEASLWCLTTTTDYSACVLAAVNLGEDADTTGAVAGGLAGLAYGRSSLRADWAASIARSAEIEELAGRLASLIGADSPLPRAYWVLPGKLLAGGYPGRDRGGSGSVAALDAILGSGVDSFLDLTSPGEEVGAERYDELLGPASSRRGVAAQRLSAPLEDMSAEGDAVRRAMRKLGELLGSGRSVYLHCVGGFGRTGTIVGSYLVERGLASADEAVPLIAALRAGTDRPATESPQTEEQRRLVLSTPPGPSALPL